MQPQGNKTLAIVSMILGISAIVFCWCFFLGLILGIVGLILAIKAKKSYDAIGQKNAMATVGLITSISGAALSLIFSTVCICTICAAAAASGSGSYSY